MRLMSKEMFKKITYSPEYWGKILWLGTEGDLGEADKHYQKALKGCSSCWLHSAIPPSSLQSLEEPHLKIPQHLKYWVHTHISPTSATGSLYMFPSVAARTSSSKLNTLRKKTRVWRQGKITNVSFSSTFWETKEASRDQSGELLFSP